MVTEFGFPCGTLSQKCKKLKFPYRELFATLKRFRANVVHIVTQKRLRDFARKHSDCVSQISTWEAVVRNAKWQNANDVKSAFPMVTALRNDRFCFNIKGNDYRLIVKVLFNAGQVLIRFVGTHAEYDKIDANAI